MNDLKQMVRKIASHYGMLGVLLLLCVFFSIVTLNDQHLTGKKAAEAIFEESLSARPKSDRILIVVPSTSEDSLLVATLTDKLKTAGFNSVGSCIGDPAAIRNCLSAITSSDSGQIVIATTDQYRPIVQSISNQFQQHAGVTIVAPPTERWPTFLLADNLRNVANQITVVAIVAIGMTMVIITAGIDLSVGSLIALSAVTVATLIGKFGGGEASGLSIFVAALAAILTCGFVGGFSGLMITRFRIPPFIATLAMMQVAAGIAYIVSQGKPVYQVPDSFVGLGRGVEPLLHIPYAVLLMIALYAVAHIVMTRTTFGRYLYAVGGNIEATRLAGIQVKPILFSAYTISGLFAGLGGVLMASQLKSGAPTYGVSYELYVIAAVVVGGTSLSGGEGRVIGSLIGALVIGVIQNGMNLTNIESYTQKIVLGLVILGAVLLDQLKQRGFRIFKR